MPGTWRHLAARFFSVLGAPPLTDDERRRVEVLLRPAEVAPFFAQHDMDQRHALEAATRVAELLPGRTDLQRAALLHDIGKRHSGLGVLGRVLASVAAKVGVKVGGRFRAYLDHGPAAAEELAGLGAEPVVVTFARHHHGARPAGIAASDWHVLMEADST
jgi:putative nucleotidyltransferase with HDIG domain